jgi:hypothetical protein
MCYCIEANTTQPPDHVNWFPNWLFFQSFDEERGVVLQEGFSLPNGLVAERNSENLSKPGMVGVIWVVEDSANTTRWCKFIFAKLFASRSSVRAIYIPLGDLADVGQFVRTDSHDLKGFEIQKTSVQRMGSSLARIDCAVPTFWKPLHLQ